MWPQDSGALVPDVQGPFFATDEHFNAERAAVRAICAVLGVLPQGAAQDVAARLAEIEQALSGAQGVDLTPINEAITALQAQTQHLGANYWGEAADLAARLDALETAVNGLGAGVAADAALYFKGSCAGFGTDVVPRGFTDNWANWRAVSINNVVRVGIPCYSAHNGPDSGNWGVGVNSYTVASGYGAKWIRVSWQARFDATTTGTLGAKLQNASAVVQVSLANGPAAGFKQADNTFLLALSQDVQVPANGSVLTFFPYFYYTDGGAGLVPIIQSADDWVLKVQAI